MKIFIIQPPIDILSIITTIFTFAALLMTMYQSKLAKSSLDAATKSIEADTRSRQISILPKTSWVIEVNIRLDKWLEDLEKIKNKTIIAYKDKDENILQEISFSIPKSPDKISYSINSILYKDMPENLKIIMMSGAQYYYDAILPTSFLWTKENGANWSYSISIQARYNKSIYAIEKLKELTSEIIPKIILDTPASIQDKDFVQKS